MLANRAPAVSTQSWHGYSLFI